MPFTIALSGMCVGVETRPYDFIDEAGQRQAGDSVALSLSEDFGAEPVRVKVPRPLHGAVQALKPYSAIEVEADLFARPRGPQSAVIEATARRIVMVDEKGRRTDVATGEALAPVGAEA